VHCELNTVYHKNKNPNSLDRILCSIDRIRLNTFYYKKKLYGKSLNNFAPQGNFGPIFVRSLASLDEFCTIHEQNRVC
jgi:hypothetical protein